MTDPEQGASGPDRGSPQAAERYRSLLETLPYAFFAADVRGHLTDVNRAAVELLGRPREELVGLRFDVVVADSDLPAAEELHRAVFGGDLEREEADFWIVRPDGSERLIHVALEVIRRGGEPVGSHGLFRDVTEERRASARLRRSEERLRLLLERMPASLWGVDREMRLTSVGGDMENHELLGMTVREAMRDSEEVTEAVEAHRRALAGEPCRFDYAWEGRLYDARVEPLREEGEIVGAIGAAVDVTERAEAEREIRAQRTYLRALFEAAPEAIVLLGETGRILDTNPEFERLFGYSADEVEGKRLPDLVVPEERLGECKALMERVLAGDRVETEAVRRRKDGSPVNVSILARPLVVEGRKRVYGIYRDITDRKLLEEQLLHSQRMEAVGQLAGGIAHDFNNILTSIIGHARVLEADAVEGRVRDDLRQIEASAERAAALVRHLLAFSQRERTDPRPVDLSAVVAELEDFFRRTLGEAVVLETELDPDLPPASVDRGQMEQVLVNLMLNARDAMAEGGVARIVSRVREGSGGRRDVVLEVIDEGRGMEEQEMARMFEPFFTTKERADASGLGLSTVYGIVEQSGGSIEVETALGEGTTVRVVLPITEGALRGSAPAPARSTERAPAGVRVLLVDDDRPVRDVTRRILEREGYDVTTAASGSEALELVDALDAPPDLLLADVVMPGMSGVELADAIVELWPDTKVLFMSGYTESELSTRSRGKPAELVSKPFDPNTLVRRVREALSAG